MLTKLWDLAFEINGDSIDLEQDAGYGDVARITLHRVHLRHLAEQAGLIPASGHADPDRTIARLARQLRLLYDRIDRLDDWLNQASQRGHEDLDEECAFSFSTWEMANEFVKDLDAVAQGSAESRGLQQESCVTNTPKSGGAQPDLLSGLDGTGHGIAMADADDGTTT